MYLGLDLSSVLDLTALVMGSVSEPLRVPPLLERVLECCFSTPVYCEYCHPDLQGPDFTPDRATSAALGGATFASC